MGGPQIKKGRDVSYVSLANHMIPLVGEDITFISSGLTARSLLFPSSRWQVPAIEILGQPLRPLANIDFYVAGLVLGLKTWRSSTSSLFLTAIQWWERYESWLILDHRPCPRILQELTKGFGWWHLSPCRLIAQGIHFGWADMEVPSESFCRSSWDSKVGYTHGRPHGPILCCEALSVGPGVNAHSIGWDRRRELSFPWNLLLTFGYTHNSEGEDFHGKDKSSPTISKSNNIIS